MPASTLACPRCSVAVSFGAGQSVAQCPNCGTLLSNSAPMLSLGQHSSSAATSTGSLPPSSTSLVRCVGCGSLLSPPPGATTFQCGTCFAVMDQTVTPSLSSSPLTSLPASISASPFASTSNSPHSSAPTSSTNSPASHTSTLSSLPASSLPSQSPTFSSVQVSAFSTPMPPASIGLLNSLISASSPPSASPFSSGSSSPLVSSSGGSSKKKRKDPQAPKRSSNAYMVFCQEQRNSLKEAEPALAFGKLGKRLGELWRNMSAEEKQPYEDKAGRDRGRYKQEMTKYQSEQMRQQMESHRINGMQQQQQRQQQQLIVAAQQHDLETRKRARMDVPLSPWPLNAQQQQPLLAMGQMAQLAQLGQLNQMGQLAQMQQLGQLGQAAQLSQLAGGMQPSMLSAGLNPLITNPPPFFNSLDPRLASLYQASGASFPAGGLLSGTLALQSFGLPSGPLSTASLLPGSLSLPPTAQSSLNSPFAAGALPLTSLTPLTTFATSGSTPLR